MVGVVKGLPNVGGVSMARDSLFNSWSSSTFGSSKVKTP